MLVVCFHVFAYARIERQVLLGVARRDPAHHHRLGGRGCLLRPLRLPHHRSTWPSGLERGPLRQVYPGYLRDRILRVVPAYWAQIAVLFAMHYWLHARGAAVDATSFPPTSHSRRTSPWARTRRSTGSTGRCRWSSRSTSSRRSCCWRAWPAQARCARPRCAARWASRVAGLAISIAVARPRGPLLRRCRHPDPLLGERGPPSGRRRAVRDGDGGRDGVRLSRRARRDARIALGAVQRRPGRCWAWRGSPARCTWSMRGWGSTGRPRSSFTRGTRW